MPLLILFTYLLREGIRALHDGTRRSAAWIIAVAVCLAGIFWGDRLDEAVIAILRFPAGIDMESLGGGLPSPSFPRWISIGASLPWIRVILPCLFVFAAAGMRRWRLAAGCLVALVVVWWGFVTARTVFAVTVAHSDVLGAMFTYVSYLAAQAALVFVAATTVASWRRADIWLGLLPALGLTAGISGIGALMPGRPYLADGLSLFTVATAIAAGIGIAARRAGIRDREFIAVAIAPVKQYDVFISYRREVASDAARLLYTGLKERGLRPFLDLNDLGSRHFDERLLEAIDSAPDFIVILSPGCLDACSDPGDWLRRELAHAIRLRRNIIPLVKEGFHFPDRATLAEDIDELPRYNAIAYSTLYFEAMMDKIHTFLCSARGEQAASPAHESKLKP